MQCIKNFFGEVLGQISDQLCPIIISHLLNNRDKKFLIQQFRKFELSIRLYLRQHIGSLFFLRNQGQQCFLIFEAEITKQVGNIGRVNFAKGFFQIYCCATTQQLTDGSL